MVIIKKTQQPIRIIHTLGGCGGTLLSQCIGVLQGVVLLSECNPLSANIFDYNLNPYIQLKQWYPDLFDKIKSRFKPEKLSDPNLFRKFVDQIKSILDKKNNYLVIRDYNYIDYFGTPFLNSPPNNSSLLSSFKKSFDLKQVLLIRHPMTQYNSLRSHDILKNTLNPSLFLKGYELFMKDFSNCKVIKYEDMVSHPEQCIADLSDYWSIPFSKNFIDDFHHNRSVTGNFRRANETKISLSKQKESNDPWANDLKTDPRYQVLLKILDYN